MLWCKYWFLVIVIKINQDRCHLFEEISRCLRLCKWEKTSSCSHREERSLLERLSLQMVKNTNTDISNGDVMNRNAD